MLTRKFTEKKHKFNVNFDHIKFCPKPDQIGELTRLHLLGKVARRAFAQESLKTMTSPTSARKTTTKSSKSWSPQDAHHILISPGLLTFWHTFFQHQNLFTNWIQGDTSFSHSFLRSIELFKAISHISGSKKWSKWVRTHTQRHTQTNRRTSKF